MTKSTLEIEVKVVEKRIDIHKEHFGRFGFILRVDRDARYLILMLIWYEITIDLW